jgi:hypothetical protein
VELYHETGGAITQSVKNSLPSLSSIRSVDLYLVGDPATGRVRGFYRVVTTGGDQGLKAVRFDNGGGGVAALRVSSGQRAAYFGRGAWAGLTVSGRQPDSPTITFSFDRFAIGYASGGAGPTPTPTPTPPPGGLTGGRVFLPQLFKAAR